MSLESALSWKGSRERLVHHLGVLRGLRSRLEEGGVSQRVSDPGLACSLYLPPSRPDGRTVVLGSLVHGNEFGTLEALVPWAEELVTRFLESKPVFPHGLLIVCANPEAGLENKRFLDQDLNRLFGERPAAAVGHEWSRVEWLQSLLLADDVALFVDLHQTIEACEDPFFIFGYHEPSLQWAEKLAPFLTRLLVTRPPGASFATGQMSGDEALRQRGVPALTIEFGQKGFAPIITERVHSLLGGLAELLENPAIFDEVAALRPPGFSQEGDSALDFYHVVERVPLGGPSARLRPGIRNFMALEKGEVLGCQEDGSELLCPMAALALFPKYPPRTPDGLAVEPWPSDIINLVERLPLATLREWHKKD